MMYPKTIILLCVFLACAFYAQAKTYVVCVGISKYKSNQPTLYKSDTDALTIQNIFAKAGAKTSSLTNYGATSQNIRNEMRVMFSQAGKDDTVILFFSGHGYRGGFCSTDGLISYQTIYEIMKQSKASKKMIFADACFAGKMRKTQKESSQYSRESVMLFLSSRSTEVSYESRYKNSWFTVYLERALRGGADNNRDKTVSAKELFDFVAKGVAQSTNGKQHPVMWGKFDDNMPIIKW